MKKRVFAALLSFALLLSMTPSVFALGAFGDVTDQETARNVEVLRLMGVVEGDGNGLFRPNSSLTRAEFCKMAVVLAGKRSVTARCRSMTIFSDVKPSHWGAGYVNYAAKDAKMIHGLPDGTFQPDRAITYGEAVAILMRQLGYADKDTGGIWPDGYIALAGEAGMTKGLSLSGNASITRAQAAKLFVNALTAENDSGKTLLGVLEYGYDTSKDPVTVWGVDMVNGKLRLSDSSTPEMENPMELSSLIGVKGYVVTKGDKAVTFLPVVSNAGGTVSDAAIIVSANGSTAGFDALTGGATNYTVYRNGVRATAGALKRGDVVTYNAANNTIQACDTRVAVYYENCEPSPAAPTSIAVLGGTEFKVMTTAQGSLAQLKPGKNMVIQLTADGRVAGAVENGTSGLNGNAFGYVNTSGKAYLICAGSLIELKLDATKTAVNQSGTAGKAVRISQSASGKNPTVYLTAQSNSTTGILDVTAKTLGTRKVADGVLVLSDGALTSLEALGVSRIEQSRISYARVNSAGEIDLIVIADNSDMYYGRAIITTEYDEETHEASERYIRIDGNGHDTKDIRSGNDVRTGDYVAAQVNSAGTMFTSFSLLTKLASVPVSAWVGDTAVNYSGQTYTVPSDVICYNRDAGRWFADLAAAKAYGGTMDLYVKDDVVRAIEVRA